MKRGQSSTESLMVYGIGLLMIVAVIASLSFFGVINPESLIPGSCLFDSELECMDATIEGGNKSVHLALVNNKGRAIDILNVSLAFAIPDSYRCNSTRMMLDADGTLSTYTLTDSIAVAGQFTMNNRIPESYGFRIQIECADANWVVDEKVQINVEVTYRNSYSGLMHTAQGTINARVGQ
ncbi:hypothetical protein H6504_04865 [Candidatus Woesearchaeota archaeon]|nr:hypothetical protein [Candidatus Woesearchaeota archaeon]